jgi:putative transposase
MTKPYTEEQIVGILHEAQAKGTVISALCRKHGITEQTFYRWRNRYENLSVPEIRTLRELAAESGRLKKAMSNG